MNRSVTRLGLAAMVLLAAALLSRCGGPPKPDVQAELQKLNIPTIPKTLSAAQKAHVEEVWDGPGKWFVQRGCLACHAVSVYGVKPFTPIGPDLSIAVDDVRTRFGRSLEEFLKEPQGTMQMVLGQLIKLSDAEKAEALKELQAAYQLHQQTKAGSK